MINKIKIGESFSKSALTYDENCDFQKETGDRLIQRILSDGLPLYKVLDIGIGTGNITQELAKRLDRNIYGCDIAWGMVSFSKKNRENIFIIQADAEDLPYRDGVFDLIFSNVTYQWVSDFESAFLGIKRILRKEGRVYFSVLVKGSLVELYDTLESSLGGDYYKGFLPHGDLIKSKFKETGFDIVWWHEEILKRYYENPLQLIRVLKSVGANRIFEFNLFGMGKRRLFFDMLERYAKNFSTGDGKVFATYKVILGCVQKL